MKEQAIKKINQIGKVSGIITLISKILVGLGIAVMLLASILCFAIPSEGFSYGIEKRGVVEIDANALGGVITQEDLDQIQKDLENGTKTKIDSGLVDVNIGGDDLESVAVEKTENGIKVIGDAKTHQMNFREMAYFLLALTALLAMTQVTLYFIGFLCKAFRDCQSPFEENVTKKMRNLAFALIPWTVASSLSDIIVNNVIKNSNTIALSVNLGMVIVVLVVFMLSYIFKYGAILQQESDETL